MREFTVSFRLKTKNGFSKMMENGFSKMMENGINEMFIFVLGIFQLDFRYTYFPTTFSADIFSSKKKGAVHVPGIIICSIASLKA